jgi:hypothetical protein
MQARSPSTPIDVKIRPSNGSGDIDLNVPLGVTVKEIREELMKRNVITASSKAKLVFGGRFLSDNESFMQLLEKYDISTPHIVHLIGGAMPYAPAPSSTSQPTTPLTSTTPTSSTTTPTPQQIQQLLQMGNVTPSTSPFGTPLTGTSPNNPFQQQLLLAQLQRLQQMQLQLAQLQQAQQQIQIQTQPDNVAQPPLDANQMPQRLVEERPRNHIVINVRIGPFLTALFRIAILCIVLFPRQGWAVWLKFTLLFTVIWLIFQYGGHLLDFFRGRPQQNQQQRPENANQNANAPVRQDNPVQAPPPNVTEAVPPHPPRGPIGTLLHIIYLFVVSLSPSYQPRGYVAPPEDLHEHED